MSRSLMLAILFGSLLLQGAPTRAADAVSDANAQPAGNLVLDDYLKTGPFKVRGTLAFDTKLFGRLAFAHTTVYLSPDSSYNQTYVRQIGTYLNTSNKKLLTEYEPTLRRYNRQVDTDADGHFEFDDLPPGRYLLDAETFYQTTSTRIDHQVVSGETWNGEFQTYNDDHLKLKVHSEVDMAAASIVLSEPQELFVLSDFHLLGAHPCCAGEF